MLTRLRLMAALLALSIGLTLLPTRALAQSEIELQALRQLEFSREEIANGSFERALSSASAAFRLDPTLYDALAYKALAYEGLGELRLAEGLLTTYLDIRGAVNPLISAEEALQRVSQKLGGGGGSEAPVGETTPENQAEPEVVSENGKTAELPPVESGTPPDGEQETEDGSSDEASSGDPVLAPEATTEVSEAGERGEAGEGEEGEEVGEAPAGPVRSARLKRLAELLPTDATLAALHLLHQRGILESRAQAGVGLMAGGLGLSGLGGILMAVGSANYAQAILDQESTAQSAAVYASALGMLGAGGAMAGVGIPIFVRARLDLKELDSLERSLAVRPAPRLELMAQGLRLRF